MSARIATVFTCLFFVFPLLAAAGNGYPATIPASQCSTDNIQCCNSLQRSDSNHISKILGILGIVLDATAFIGVTCDPISVIGVGGNSCSAQPVCCQQNHFGGVVATGCTPVNLNL